MRFAKPISVACPSCGKVAGYDPKHLLALSAYCASCSTSLRAAGLEMREQVTNWEAYLVRIEVALELEETFGIQIQDSDLERVQMPSQLVRLVAALAPKATYHHVSTQVISAITRVRKKELSESDLNRDFAELLSQQEDG